MSVLAELEPKSVMFFFEALSGRHRCSRHESDAVDYVAEFATERGLRFHRDDLDNIIVKKQGTPGYESAPPVILHGHIDMVCKVEDGVSHDFAKDGVKLAIDGDLIRARGTTLGADNGLGIAYMLTLLDADDIPHPPLECVMTVMEEMGKVGGDNVDLTQLTGKRMIDFNWIDERQLLAGCSGDISCRIEFDAKTRAPTRDRRPFSLRVAGLKGGHCEFDIHLERGNAIVLLARLLRSALECADIETGAVTGGVQNNVIPSESEAILWVAPDDVEHVKKTIAAMHETLAFELQTADPGLTVRFEPAEEASAQVMSGHDARTLVRAIALLPNGIQSQNLDVPGNWETSNNIGFMRTRADRVEIICTITSAVTSRKHAVFDRIHMLAEMAGDSVRVSQVGLDAPEFRWKPDSDLLATVKDSYADTMGRQPDVLVSICSLELGMFTQRIDGLETVGIGTNLYDLHSPQEAMDHTSAARVWPLIQNVLKRLDH